MQLRVFVTLKPSVLDPQGMTIRKALHTLGFERVEDVRQGKYFEIEWDGPLSGEEDRARVERLAAEVLSNPVIEGYRIEWPADGVS